MTQIVLPGMVRRRRGLIVNVSSAIAKLPAATLASYGASKSFVDYFSTALSYEYEDKGITIQVSLNYFRSFAPTWIKINNPLGEKIGQTAKQIAIKIE